MFQHFLFLILYIKKNRIYSRSQSVLLEFVKMFARKLVIHVNYTKKASDNALKSGC